MADRKPILIVTSSYDEHAFGPVASALERLGWTSVIYKTDKVLTGKDDFSLNIADNGDLSVQYNGQGIGPGDVSAAWYWKPHNFEVPDVGQNVSKQLSLVNEITEWDRTIWALYPEAIWLNSPRAIDAANRKLGQLQLARSIGLHVPPTVVTSSWRRIDEGLLDGHTEIIVKMLRGVIADQNVVKAMPTTRLSRSDITSLRDLASPFPGLWQPFIQKAREWRITIAGSATFATAIYTSDDAKDDWRKLQQTSSVRFSAEVAPPDIVAKCHTYLARSQLAYGAFDFIEQPNSEIVFLECNPNGQYGWLEEELSYPISRAIARALADIASRSMID